MFSATVAYLAHLTVRELGLDKSIRLLRFNNHWFYLLSGESSQFSDARTIVGEIDGVILTTIVHHSESDYLYRGVLTDFFFDKDGNLDRVYLSVAARRRLTADRGKDEEIGSPESEARYYDIDGDHFVLKYSEMCTINIDYFFIIEEDEFPAQSAEESSDDIT